MNQHHVTDSEVISQLRLPLIVLVTYAHSYSGGAGGDVLRLLVGQTLVKVSVPVFFIVSGYLFFRNVVQWNLEVYVGKIRRRARSLLLPYLVWNLLMVAKLHTFSWSMFWNYWGHAGMQTDWLGHENWMTAPANLPLWFLRDLMVVSLFSPIIYIGLRHRGTAIVGVLTVVYLSGVGAFALPGLSACSLCFFSIGALLGIRKQSLIRTALRVELPAYILSAGLVVAMQFAYGTPVFSSLMLAFRLTGAAAVLCLGRRLLSVTARRLPAVCSKASYFVYLAHYVFFLSFIDAVFFRLPGCDTWVHYLLAPLLKAVLMVAVYVVFVRCRELFLKAKNF